MNLYALLIGINDYPGKPLSQCVDDVEKVSRYLESLKPSFSEMEIKKLLDKEAGKEAILEGIGNSFSRATDEDVCLLYYSGHGAQEATMGRFQDENDGLLECLVSYFEKDQRSGFLLADKEVRYRLSGLKSNPHLVTVFDCCHSGDMVRAFGEDDSECRRKRIAGVFPARNFDDFIFSDRIAEAELKNKSLSEVLPFKNHIHLAACLPDESSWEDRDGGVFTSYLMHLLKANENRLSYADIAKWARVGLKDVKSRKQTPTFSVQGTGKIKAASSWLNLFPEGDSADNGKLVYNLKSGWNYTRGLLMGVKEGMTITVIVDKNNSFDTKILSSDLESSVIDDPVKEDKELETTKEYDVITTTTFTKPTVYVNDLEREGLLKAKIEEYIRKSLMVELSDASAADFFINIFNQMVYISNSGDEFRPLAGQIDLLKHENDYLDILKNQLTCITRWHHFFSLSNPDNHFDQSPLKIEINLVEGDSFCDITDGQILIEPEKVKYYVEGERLYLGKFSLKITNISSDVLYVGVLELNSDFSINSEPYDNLVIKLQPGESKFFYDHKKSIAKITLDKYKEVYNWKSEYIHYKFIVNNYEDFTTSLKDFVQDGLEHPLIPESLESGTRGVKGGGGFFEEKEAVCERWGTVLSTIYMNNPDYNIITQEMESFWKYSNFDDRIAPFIGKLYFDTRVEGLSLKSTTKPNRLGEDQATKGFWDVKLNVANLLDNQRRKRIFQRARIKMPDKPVVIAEGDSWFLYPFLVKDTVDYVMEEFPVRSLAAAGDTLEHYKESGQLLQETAEIRPEFVLISGGGNDIIGPEIVDILKKNAGEGLHPAEYLNAKYSDRRKTLSELYEYFFIELRKHHSVRHIFVHGYDYVRTDHKEDIIRKGWVNKYMIEYGIKNAADRERLIRYLVDNFNNDLEKLTKRYDNSTYLDMRGLVNQNEWYDEIHPNDTGFAKVGSKFIKAINEF